MFVAAYDDRVLLPDYFDPFIRSATKFCNLHLITPAINLPAGVSTNSTFNCRRIPPSSLPQYRHICKLFDDIFVNYSTNREAFERSCFHRWFALNAATNNLVDEEYICLLDTDFLLGMSPDDVLSKCCSRAGLGNIQFIAEWDSDDPVTFGPEFTIITKSFLHGFCEYLLTTYYSPDSKKEFIQVYYDVIGRGLAGGISDMRAIASYAKPRVNEIFNLRDLDEPQIIGNFNCFLHDEIGCTDNWKIVIEQHGQILHSPNWSKPLIGVHFQGKAKPNMYFADGKKGDITRARCAAHLACKSTRLRRASNKLKSHVNNLIKRAR